MNILITGAAGFIGSHLYEKLAKDNEVVGIDNDFHPSDNPAIAGKIKYADIRYYHNIESHIKEADVVYHLAAQIHVDRSITNPQETIDINVTGTLNVLEAVRKYNKKMVFASSSEVYGTAQTKFIDETHPLDGQSPYAASKTAGDRLCKAYYETYGLKVAILRNFNTFGSYQDDASYGGAIAIFTRQALQGKPLEVFGDGNQERDYISVTDALQGYELCVTKELWGKPINIGSGQTVKIQELAQTIIDLAESKSKIINVKPRPGEVQRLCADVSMAKGLGFKPATNFNQDLKNYVQWYKNTILPTLR